MFSTLKISESGDSMRNMSNTSKKVLSGFSTAFKLLILYGIAFIIVYPFIFMFVSSFRGREDLISPSVVWVTRHFTLEHIEYIFDFIDYPSVISYTAMIAIGSAVLQTFVCEFVGYGFAKYNFRFKKFFFCSCDFYYNSSNTDLYYAFLPYVQKF